MKRLSRRIMAFVIAMIMVVGMGYVSPLPTFAASTRKGFTINTGNTQVYSNTALTKKGGTIYDSDELIILNVTSSYSQVSYPITGTNRYKTGYIRTSAILLSTGGKTYTAVRKATTYKRPGGASYGYVAKGDKVMELGRKGGYIQLKYPVSGGFKYAFVREADDPSKGSEINPNDKATKAVNLASSKVGQSYANGMCERFVEETYQAVGVKRVYMCCASHSGDKYIRSTSSSNIPVGATVYFGRCGGGSCRSCGNQYYGHVGIYVGNGYFVHATGGRVQKSTISSWGSKYRGWGYYANFK